MGLVYGLVELILSFSSLVIIEAEELRVHVVRIKLVMSTANTLTFPPSS